MKFRFPLLITLLLLFPLFSFAQEENTEKRFHVSPYYQECMGLAPMNCLVVRPLPDEQFGYFFDAIEGFDFEEGYEYIIRVSVTEIENPPADASSLHYELLEIEQQFPARLDGKLWVLQSFADYDSVDMNKFTLLFNADGTVAITSDCNSIMLSEYVLNPAEIVVNGMTRMFCEFSLESQFVEALSSIRFLAIENGELVMSSDEGMLRFAPQDIDGIEWHLQSYQSEELAWEDDGTVNYTLRLNGTESSLQLACNSGGGTVEREGAVLKFGMVVSTLMACMDEPLAGIYPPQEAVYSVNADGQLILETASGEVFTFVASE